MKRRALNRWSLRLQLSYIVVLSVILVVAVSVNKIRSIKSQSSSIPVGFQHDSSHRSTMDIIYSCISTMIICTISVMHFDVPENTAHRLGFWKKIKSPGFWEEAGSSVIYWSIGFLMPELLVTKSCRVYYIVLEDFTIMHKLHTKWTLQHSFFASMGGIHA